MKKAISFFLQSPPKPPPLLPITAEDRLHMVQILQSHILGIPVCMMTMVLAYKLREGEAHGYILAHLTVSMVILLLGILLCKIYIEGLGILLCVFGLFAFIGSYSVLVACAVGISGAVLLATILYTLIKHRGA